MKTIFLVPVFVFVVACSGSKGDKNTGTPNLSNTDLQKISDEVCPSGQTLKLMSSDKLEIRHLRQAIAFVSGDGSCAISNDIDDKWPDLSGRLSFFRLSIDNTCVPNQSIWKFESRRQDRWDEIHYRYSNVEGTRTISMSGNDDIGATYARDHAGIRVLQCQ